MKKIKFLLIPLVLSFSVHLCAQKKGESGAYYDYGIRCQGVEMDGTVTLESYGKGRNLWDAGEQAKKNAVSALLFNGIKEGNGGCSSDPLLISSSPETVHEEYFAAFFADDGPYLEYVSVKDERILRKMKRNAKKSKNMQQRMVVVRVDRLGLKKMLRAENIK